MTGLQRARYVLESGTLLLHVQAIESVLVEYTNIWEGRQLLKQVLVNLRAANSIKSLQKDEHISEWLSKRSREKKGVTEEGSDIPVHEHHRQFAW